MDGSAGPEPAATMARIQPWHGLDYVNEGRISSSYMSISAA